MQILENDELSPSFELLAGYKAPEMDSFRADLRLILTRNIDFIDPAGVDRIIDKEFELRYGEYLKGRVLGLQNDGISVKPGLTLYVTTEGKGNALRLAPTWKTPLEETEFLPALRGNAWKLRLPEGVFSDETRAIVLRKKVLDRDNWLYLETAYIPKGGCPFPLAFFYPEVIRIVGDSNELWQNRDFNWDGTSKDSTKA